jgi:hypothetical protein
MKELEGCILVMVGAQKINKIDDQLRKRYADHRWVVHEEDHGMSGKRDSGAHLV